MTPVYIFTWAIIGVLRYIHSDTSPSSFKEIANLSLCVLIGPFAWFLKNDLRQRRGK